MQILVSSTMMRVLSFVTVLWLVPRVMSTHAVQQQQQQQLRGGGGGTAERTTTTTTRRTLLLLPDTLLGEVEAADDDEEGTTTCGGLRATICALPEFETLCDLFHRLEEEEENGLEFLGHVGTFFAPTNQALEQLTSRWAVQLQTNPPVLRNLLQYHAVRTSVTLTGEDAEDVDDEDPTNTTTTAIADGGGVVYFVEDFECDSEWLMMNNQTTKTWCVTNPDFGKDETKIQLGNGNLAARTLPTIIMNADDPAGSSTSRRTCDRTAIIHKIDQVILPAELVFDDEEDDDALRLPSSAPEDGVATTVPLLLFDDDDNSTTIMGRQDNSNTNNDNSNSNSSSTTNNCGGIYDTVCAQSQLTQLCALFQQLELEEESGSRTSSLDFLHSTGTFFAPINSAFVALPATLVSDLQQPQILAHVLQYHAVRMIPPPSSSGVEDDDTDDSSVFLFWDELTCDQELRMQNNATTKTLCLNRKKIQLGSGNMALRTLPTILPPPPTTVDSSGETPTTTSLLTCDRQAIIHLVDQVILPELPLTTTTTSGDSANSSNSTGASQKEEENAGTLEGTDEVEDPVMSEDETNCPMVPPDIVASTAVCFTIGKHCGYGQHIYTGCTWRDLHCSPTTECVCLGNTDNNTTTTGSLSSWECTNTLGTFPVCDDDDASTSTTSSSSSALDRRASLPRNEECNPDDPLPEPPRVAPPNNEDDTTALAMAGRGPPIDEREPPPALSSDCPDAIEAGTSCSGTYVSQLVCHYNYIWFGCSVQELDCAPVHECECNPSPFEDGNWACRSFARVPNCPAATTPSNLPWGQYCNNN